MPPPAAPYETVTPGRVLVEDALPADLAGGVGRLDKKGLEGVLRGLAGRGPDAYRDHSHRLLAAAGTAAELSGGYGFSLDHLTRPAAARRTRLLAQARTDAVLRQPGLSDTQREGLIVRAVGGLADRQADDTWAEALAAGHPAALQAASGARGNKGSLATLLAGDLLYSDHKDRVIPVPILRSYGEGLSPAEYWASTYGARKGVLATKLNTASAGYHCLAAGTEVRMADFTVRRIEDVRAGERVLGADRCGNTFPTRVIRVFANGPRPVSRFRFRYGQSRSRFLTITATPEHKALLRCIRRGVGPRPQKTPYVTVTFEVTPLGGCARKPNCTHALAPTTGYVGGDGVSEPFAWLVGLLLGNGGLTTHHIGFSTGDLGLIEQIRAVLTPDGYSLPKAESTLHEYRLRDDHPLPAVRDAGGQMVAGHFRHRLRPRLSELGLLGCRSPQKRMPAEVDRWDNDSVAALLRGLFTTDGCVKANNNQPFPTVQLDMTAEHVVRRAQELLAWRFGVYGQTTVRDITGQPVRLGYESYANHPMATLVISDRQSVLRFRDRVGLDSTKAEKLRALIPTDETAGRTDGFVHHFLDNEAAGLAETFDLEVEHPDHLYVLANGAVVSNSKLLGQATHRLVVTDDDPEPDPAAPPRGLPVAADDPDSDGALLAAPAGGYPRNTQLTPKVRAAIRAAGVEHLLVRSPAVGGHPDGRVYARDVGYREANRLPTGGDFVGLLAAQALCLAEGTLVRLADADELVPVERVTVGTRVLGYALSRGGGRPGTPLPVRVTAVHANGDRHCHRFRWAGGHVWCTPDHRVLAADAGGDRVRPAGEADGHRVRLAGGGRRAFLRDRRSDPKRVPTYDLTVDHPDHLFVLAGGLVVHNSEPVAQGQLSSKHSGGVAGRGPSVGGFQLLSNLIQVPRESPGWAPVSEAAGRVEAVEAAPAGGHRVRVGETTHFVPAGQPLRVAVGDRVEAGDPLADGVPNPAAVVRLKGVGEGRRQFVESYRRAMRDAGMPAHRRNVELLARGLIDRVELTAEAGDHAPGDVVPYQTLEAAYAPRDGAAALAPRRAIGRYLDAPALHYTIGTRLTRAVADELDRYGVGAVTAHPEPPPFTPVMVRAADFLQDDPDWLTRMYGSGLKRSFLAAAHRGAAADPTGTSFVPALAVGAGFGDAGPLSRAPADRVKVSDALGDAADAFGKFQALGGFQAGALAGRRPPGPGLGIPGAGAVGRGAGGGPGGGPDITGDLGEGFGGPTIDSPLGPAPDAGGVGRYARPAALVAGGGAGLYAAGKGLERVAPSLVGRAQPGQLGPVGRTLAGADSWLARQNRLVRLPGRAAQLAGVLPGSPVAPAVPAVTKVTSLGKTVQAIGKPLGVAGRALPAAGAAVDAFDVADRAWTGYRAGGLAGALDAGAEKVRRDAEDFGTGYASTQQPDGTWKREKQGITARVMNNVTAFNPFAVASNLETIGHGSVQIARGVGDIAGHVAEHRAQRAQMGRQDAALAVARAAPEARAQAATRADSAARYRQALAAGHAAGVPWRDPQQAAVPRPAPVWRTEASGERWLDEGYDPNPAWTPALLADHDRQAPPAAPPVKMPRALPGKFQ